MSIPRIGAVDLFCGAGGLSCGLSQAGIRVLGGVDMDEKCRFPFEENIGAKFVCQSVTEVSKKDLEKLWGKSKVRLLAGCAPCQPFSSQRRGVDTSREKEWGLLGEFERLVEETLPDYVTMENVTGLQRQPVFASFVTRLESLGYSVDYKVLKGENFGLPQRRRRLVLAASAHGPLSLPTSQEGAAVSVGEALAGLPRLKAGEHDKSDPLHKARALSPLNLARLRASRPGGTWLDWPEDLRAPCQRRDSGQSFKSFYGVMNPAEPSPTITTQFFNYGSGRFGHPFQERTITPREAAILQGFPRDYRFVEPGSEITFKGLGKMIGNAVPPVFGKLVGELFTRDLQRRR
ncbi:DNA cytosine methyltransferase [Actinotignum timonense]